MKNGDGCTCKGMEQLLCFACPTAISLLTSLYAQAAFILMLQDVDALWTTLKDHTNIYYGIETFEYGMREFAIKDNNGYILQFGKQLQV